MAIDLSLILGFIEIIEGLLQGAHFHRDAEKKSLSIGRTLGLRIENRVITAFTKPEAGGK